MRARLLVAFVALTVVVLAVTLGPLVPYLHRVETDRVLADLERDAFILSGPAQAALGVRPNSPPADGSVSTRTGADAPDEERNPLGGSLGAVGDPAAALSTTVAVYADQRGATVVVVDRQGVVVTGSSSALSPGSLLTDDDAVRAALRGRPSAERTAIWAGPSRGDILLSPVTGRHLVVVVPVISGASVVGAVGVAVDDDVGAVTRRRATALLIAALGVLAAAGIAAHTLASTLSRPLDRLRLITERIAGGRLADRADPGAGPPAVRSLAQSFNTMADRLELLIDEQRAFAGNAAHQLRTPLTALALQLERASRLLDDDPTSAAVEIEATRAEVDRLSHLVTGLLLLARADAHHPRPAANRRTVGALDRGPSGSYSVDTGLLETGLIEGGPLDTGLLDTGLLEAVDVDDVVDERVELWGALAAERNVTVARSERRPSTPWADADAGALEQMLDNLLDNALKASPSGGTVMITTTPEPDSVVIGVEDEGPGLTDAQLDAASGRFWRAPDAPYPGTGLGLAIVERLARHVGGELKLARRSPTGLRVTIRLPIAPPRRRPHIATPTTRSDTDRSPRNG